MKVSIVNFLDRTTKAAWVVIAITNVLGITNIPWNYVLVPMIMVGVMAAFIVFGFLNNVDDLQKKMNDEKLVELLQKHGYKVEKRSKL